jgi:hypothetical protein
MTNSPRPPVRPLTEGYVVKGGHNSGTSQIQTRPAAPKPIPAPKPAPASSSPPTGGRRDG